MTARYVGKLQKSVVLFYTNNNYLEHVIQIRFIHNNNKIINYLETKLTKISQENR